MPRPSKALENSSQGERDKFTKNLWWQLQGSADEESYTMLFEPPNPSYIGNELEYYLIDTTGRFNIFYCFAWKKNGTIQSMLAFYAAR